MVSSSLIVRLAAPIGEWWLPGLGVLLTGCGVGLLSANAGELVAPTHPADSAVRSTVVVETIASRVTPPAPAVGEARPGAGKVVFATPSGVRGDPALDAGAVPREAEGLDLAAAALYGPPDRVPTAASCSTNTHIWACAPRYELDHDLRLVLATMARQRRRTMHPTAEFVPPDKQEIPADVLARAKGSGATPEASPPAVRRLMRPDH